MCDGRLTSSLSAQGYDNEERAYIATQGPLAHTLEDFWLMVLSRRAPAVVMITKLRENGRIKCAGYLPETRQKATFGKIEVTVKRILPRNGYTLRQVTVKVSAWIMDGICVCVCLLWLSTPCVDIVCSTLFLVDVCSAHPVCFSLCVSCVSLSGVSDARSVFCSRYRLGNLVLRR